jgi:integrase
MTRQRINRGFRSPRIVTRRKEDLGEQNLDHAARRVTSTEFPAGQPFLSVREAAALLRTSESWIRRHIVELPAVRVGRLLRFDSALLLRQFQGKYSSGNRLKPERMVPMGCKRYQKGSLIKRGKRGRQMWYGIWREDIPNADGGLIRRQRCVKLGSVSEFPTREKAREQLSQLMSKKPSVEMKFSELFERWKEVIVPTLKDSTAGQYVFKLARYAVPVFGSSSIAEISRYEVEQFLADKAKMHCRNTLRAMRASLSQMLSWAVSHQWIAKNPCSGVKVPHGMGSKVKRLVLAPEQVLAIAEKLEEPYATLVLFLAITGVRIGEAIAIKWSDFDGDTLHIQRRIYERREGPPKTPKSVRCFPIPSRLLDRMRQLGDGEWVFRSKAGTPVNPGNALKRYIRPTAAQLGIPIGGWHDFKHTVSTKLLKRHPLKVVSELVGTSEKQLLETYQHVQAEDFRAPLNEMSAELLANVSKSASWKQSPGSGLLN